MQNLESDQSGSGGQKKSGRADSTLNESDWRSEAGEKREEVSFGRDRKKRVQSLTKAYIACLLVRSVAKPTLAHSAPFGDRPEREKFDHLRMKNEEEEGRKVSIRANEVEAE